MTLVRRMHLGDLELTSYPFMLEFGSDMGNAGNEIVSIESLLADGQLESVTRRSNRTMTIPLEIAGSDMAVLAQAEAALIAECDKRKNTLTLDPGDNIGPVTVFDTMTVHAQRVWGDGSDEAEIALRRRWVLTISALPFGRSAALIIDDAGAPPADDSGTLFETCESATGWATWDPNPSTAALADFTVDTVDYTEGTGSIKSLMTIWEEGFLYGPAGIGYYLSPAHGHALDEFTDMSLDTDGGGYVSVGIKGEAANTTTVLGIWMALEVGVWTEVPTWTTLRHDGNGFVHYAWSVDADLTIVGLRFKVEQRRSTHNVPRPYTWYDEFRFLSTLSTDNQVIKQLTVKGSARTTGALHIASPTDLALGKVLVVTTPTDEVPAGFRPDARRYVTQGSTTPDATTHEESYYTPHASNYDDSTGKPIFDVPVGTLAAGPSTPYTMVGLVKAESSSLTFGVQAQLMVDGNEVGPASAAEYSPTGLTIGWQILTIGTVYLPPVPMQYPDATAKARLLFKGAKFANVYLVPAWQVGGRPVADFSIIDCGSGSPEPGGPSSHAWIDLPSADQPQGGRWRGASSDRANAISAWADTTWPGVHTFRPGGLTAFLVATGVQGATLTMEYHAAHVGMATL